MRKINLIKRHKQNTLIIVFFLVILFCVQTTFIQASSNIDFSMSIQNDELIIKLGGSATSIIYLNTTSNNTENVTLSGEWVGTQPQNVTVNISDQSGIAPFTTNIKFSHIGLETGDFIYKIIAQGESFELSKDIQINITYNNTILIQSNNNYTKGERIHISGNITTNPLNNSDFYDGVTITLSNDSWQRYVTISLQNNTYDYYYNISYGDPEGIWNLSAQAIDSHGNILVSYKEINVTLPSDTMRYKVVWYSPPDNSIYQRGSSVNISVFITEDGTGVKNAFTNCIFPTMVKINLTEIKQGYYWKDYKLPWDSEIGIWVLSLESKNDSGDSVKAGGNNISIEIKPATIKLDLVEPAIDEYKIGDTIEIKVNLSYSDSTIVEDANVTAEILNETLNLVEKGNGTYSIDYKINEINKGSFIIGITASDPYGNNNTCYKVIQIIYVQSSESSFITIIIAVFILVVVVFALYLLKKRFYLLRSKDIQAEIKEIKKLQNETATKYYKDGSISRTSYDLLRKEHEERLAELKKGK